MELVPSLGHIPRNVQIARAQARLLVLKGFLRSVPLARNAMEKENLFLIPVTSVEDMEA
jgi:hypothetical protein